MSNAIITAQLERIGAARAAIDAAQALARAASIAAAEASAAAARAVTAADDAVKSADEAEVTAAAVIDAAQAEIAAAEALIAAENAPSPSPAPEPAPAPPPGPAPSPAPEPAPVPAPPAPSTIGQVVIEPMKMARVLAPFDYHEFAQYQRFQKLRVLRGPGERIRLRCFDLSAGGALQVFQRTEYPLMAAAADDTGVFGEPREIGRAMTPAGSTDVWLTVDATALPAGWLKVNLGNPGPDECSPTWFYWNQPAGQPLPEQRIVPVVRGLYERAMLGSTTHMWTLAPNNYAPTVLPAGKRTYLPPDPKLARSGLHCEFLVPMRWGDIHRPNRNKGGIVSSFDNQAYTWSALHAKMPTIGLLDGPRGVGCIAYGTHFQVSTAVVDGVPRNNTYFCDPWRVGKISEDGTITTLVGYRHKGIAGHWEDVDNRFGPGTPSAYSQLDRAGIELVGDWSAIPEDRRGFWELWGMAWDERTLVLDTSTRIPTEGNENPHLGAGPVMFAADSQHNRVCKIQFSATAHGVPPVVTEFIPAQDPWDCVCADGVLYVSERKAHRICAYDATTGKLLRVVVQGQALATVNDQIRRVTLTTTLDAARAAPCVAPEGLFLQDGWLYFGSKAQAQVRRVRLDGSGLEVVRPVAVVDGLSEFVKLAVSDGTFGPRGTTFTWTWSNAQFGGPEVYFPDGSQMLLWWNLQNGGTGWWKTTAGYGAAGAVAQGRLICANMSEGVYRITRSQAGDIPYTEAATDPVVRGLAEWHRDGHHLLHGHHGMGFYGAPLPWGKSADIDAYLANRGHVRPA